MRQFDSFKTPRIWQSERIGNLGIGMDELVRGLTARQLWALIVLLEGGLALGHGLKHNQGGIAPGRVNSRKRG